MLWLLIAALVLLLVVILVLIVYSRLSLGRCKSSVCLVGKTALVTGGNSGIGYQTAVALAGRGCRVIIADKDNCEKSKENIIKESGNTNIVIKHFDLASLASVRKLAKDLNESEERLDILINNAGTSGLGNSYTEDGLHLGMQVNHFGSFLLTHLLVDLLKKSAPSRIVFVSSIAAFFGNLSTKTLNYSRQSPPTPYSEFMVYSNSKLCNIIAAKGFAKRLQDDGIISNALHPGVVHTPIYKKYSERVGSYKIERKITNLIFYYILKLFSKNPEEGAQTTIHLAVAKEVEAVTGNYFIDCKPFLMPRCVKNQLFTESIWRASEEYVKLTPDEKL